MDSLDRIAKARADEKFGEGLVDCSGRGRIASCEE
jgi:hypothetical protein